MFGSGPNPYCPSARTESGNRVSEGGGANLLAIETAALASGTTVKLFKENNSGDPPSALFCSTSGLSDVAVIEIESLEPFIVLGTLDSSISLTPASVSSV